MPNERTARGLLGQWAAGNATVGASCKVPSPVTAEAVAAAGFDYVYVDQQHGVFDDTELFATLQAIASAGAAPVTRVPVNRAELIHKSLDLGAAGVIIPQVESAAEAAAAAAACRYPPEGNRSYGVLRTRAAWHEELAGHARPACIVLVESERAMAELDAIAATEGVDAVMIGPQDLAYSMGIPLRGNWLRNPRLQTAFELVRTTCDRRGLVAGIGASSGAEAQGWLRRGFRLVNIGNDLAYIQTALRRELAASRAAGGNGHVPVH